MISDVERELGGTRIITYWSYFAIEKDRLDFAMVEFLQVKRK